MCHLLLILCYLILMIKSWQLNFLAKALVRIHSFFFFSLGVGGLLLAHMLLVKKKETSVCIFERENHLGGKIYDYFFSQAPEISVGQFSVKKKKLFVCFSGRKNVFLHFPNFLHDQKMTGKSRVMNHSFVLHSQRTIGQEWNTDEIAQLIQPN